MDHSVESRLKGPRTEVGKPTARPLEQFKEEMMSQGVSRRWWEGVRLWMSIESRVRDGRGRVKAKMPLGFIT